jgi:SAM-dependent methyltransferase
MDNFNPKEYWENRLQSAFGLKGVGYTGLGYNYNKWLYKVRRYIFNRKVLSIRSNLENVSVLDVGCGNGFYIERWKELGVKDITGIDITNISVKNLRRKFPESNFYQVDIGSGCLGRIEERRFDVISALDILFHVVEDKRYEKAIKNIYSLLKSDGIFLWSDNFLQKGTYRATHQVCRSLKYIESVILSTGFQIVQRCPVFYLMNTPVDTLNRYHHLLWRLITFVVSKHESLGWFVGLLLFPFELAITNVSKEGPTTELMICRKN